MKRLKIKIASLVLGLLFSTFLSAQTDLDSNLQRQLHLIEMKNGDEFKGEIIKQDSSIILLKTEYGEVNLVVANVKSIEEYNYKGKYGFPNPHYTRYFFAPSGMPIEKGKGYYQNLYVTFNFVNVGITKNFSIGGGFEFISTFNGSPIWFLTPKLGFEVAENVHIGTGLLMLGLASEGSASLAYGVLTIGDNETNLSLGTGYGLVDGGFSDYPAIVIAGTSRLSNGLSVLSENYIFPNSLGESLYLGIHGIRLLSRKNAFDIGAMIIPAIAGESLTLPFVGYSRAF
jgi:hypothetical protein